MPVKKLTSSKKKGLGATLGAAAIAFAGISAGTSLSPKPQNCGGSDRWEQKVLIDDRAVDVKTTPKLTDIRTMNHLPDAPAKVTGKTERMDLEMQVYTIKNCSIVTALHEADDDYHLALKDPSGGHMIAEIPNPNCSDAFTSEYRKNFQVARKVFLNHKKDYKDFLFDITGVLFYDKQHSNPPTGNSPNNIELHPIIKIVARPKP